MTETPQNYQETQETRKIEPLGITVEHLSVSSTSTDVSTVVTGQKDDVLNILFHLQKLSNFPPYKQKAREMDIRRLVEHGPTLDIDVPKKDGGFQMLRFISYGVEPNGNVEVNLGGGGNAITATETKDLLDQAIENALTEK